MPLPRRGQHLGEHVRDVVFGADPLERDARLRHELHVRVADLAQVAQALPTHALKRCEKIMIFLEALPSAPLSFSIALHFLPALDPLPVSDNLALVF